MRQSNSIDEPDDDDLPDFSHLSIETQYYLELQQAGQICDESPPSSPTPSSPTPSSPTPSSPTPSSLTATASSPTARQQREGVAVAPRAGGLAITVNVHATNGPVTVNVGDQHRPAERAPNSVHPTRSTPGSRRDGTPVRRRAVARAGPVHDQAAPPQASRAAPPGPDTAAAAPVPYVIRGGGKAIAWNPLLEHLPTGPDPTHRRKWYVVTAGLRVGLWRSWLDMEEYIDVPGSRHAAFDTYELARYHYDLAQREGRVRLLIK
ncbi:hypothetical protein C8Q76DRAFT_688985 [Earliella scabrosa]|nr:hypothetical protein C8Q76DRAFT_688985 [Earliella scabrosa]